MRKLNDDKAYTEDDIAWIRQAGIPFGEERIAQNAERFKTEVPPAEPDGDGPGARPAVGQEAAGTALEFDPGSGAPRLVSPVVESDSDEAVLDDYDTWKVPELESEVKARNEMPDTTEVEVVGTGKDGKVVKPDLIKGLRLWDAENPDALKDDDED
jgi:hypothetical protein